MEILIETDRLILRKLIDGDAEELSAICNQQFVLKWMPDWEGTVAQRRDWLKWVVSEYDEASKTKARIMLAVILKESHTLIGMVGIGNKQEVDNEIEIAYFISEQYCNKGYISEAAKAMSEWTMQHIGIEYLIAIVETDNFPSQRVVEKCGFVKIDTRFILNSGETEEKPFFYYRLYPSGVNV